MLWFLFWVFFIWFCIILLQGAYRAFKVYRQSRKLYNNFFGGETSRKDKSRQAKEDRPAAPRKKIADDVGEYVHYEEIEVTCESTTKVEADKETTTTKITVEEQVVDVQWEDIP